MLYASCINLNHILYENSPRYELKYNSKAWRCREGYKPGDATPEKREEAFPELWNQHPEALLRLLLESECLPVHEFAIKAIKASQVFCASINIDTIIKLLQKAYEITAEFGFELTQPKYNPQKPNRELVLAVISCVSQSARNQGYQWIEVKPEYFLEDSSFIFALLTSQHEDTRSFGRRLLSFSILSDAAAKVILGRIITELLAFTTENNSEIVKEISEIVLLRFAPQLQSLNMGVISDLLAHPMLEVQEFGARVLLNHQISSENLPQSVIESLLASPYESLRIIGIQLFGQLPDAKLVGEERELVIAIALNPNLEIRNAVKPIVTRLAIAYPNFALEIAKQAV